MVGVAGAGAGVVVLEPESLELDLLEPESDEEPESLDVLLDDEEDFGLPPRLSVL